MQAQAAVLFLLDAAGYELMRDLNFTNAASYRSGIISSSWTTGSGWIPIGGDYDGIYSGVFEGNGKTISHLFIHNITRENLGLFAAVNGSVSNLNLYDAFIRGAGNLGILSGKSEDNQLINITAQGRVLGTRYGIGGISGEARNITLANSTLSQSILRGTISIGGLIGYGERLMIISSYASNNTLLADSQVGGLVGQGENCFIVASYTKAASINGTRAVGGIIGNGTDSSIISSYVTADSEIEGESFIGGLAGGGNKFSMIFSYAAGLITNKTSQAGGLIGGGEQIKVTDSYWDLNSTSISTGIYGEAATTENLTNPMDFINIYGNWNNATIDRRAVWCDTNFDGRISSVEENKFIWNFGNRTEYPAISCAPSGISVQRSSF